MRSQKPIGPRKMPKYYFKWNSDILYPKVLTFICYEQDSGEVCAGVAEGRDGRADRNIDTIDTIDTNTDITIRSILG